MLEHSFPKGGEDPNDLVGTEMIVNDGVIEVLEEKPLYNGNDFVADVGGYLGLLLGASILTIYQDATKFLADKWRRKK